MTNGQTKYVPGHGPLATRADIVRYRDMLTAVRYLVRAEIQANKTEDQAVADKPLAPIGKILGSTQQARRQHGADGLSLLEEYASQSGVVTYFNQMVKPYAKYVGAGLNPPLQDPSVLLKQPSGCFCVVECGPGRFFARVVPSPALPRRQPS